MLSTGSDLDGKPNRGSGMFINSVNDWAIETFGACDSGDKRRTQRLVKVASSLASHIGQSLVKSCGSTAEIEGAYRLLRVDAHNVSTPILAAQFNYMNLFVT
jgi:hypothetical protein